MATRNFGFQKRQKEEARQKKKDEKLARRREAKAAAARGENTEEPTAELPSDAGPQADGAD